jgi:hypothetical protein
MTRHLYNARLGVREASCGQVPALLNCGEDYFMIAVSLQPSLDQIHQGILCLEHIQPR